MTISSDFFSSDRLWSTLSTLGEEQPQTPNSIQKSLDSTVKVDPQESFDHSLLTPSHSLADVLAPYSNILSLDVSPTSTGVFFKHGTQLTATNLPPLTAAGPHVEVMMRRELKELLLGILPTRSFDLITIEDVFAGKSSKVARILYALNTAIDELILDGLITTERFIRSNNVTWKSYLADLVGPDLVKRLPDKLRVQTCLAYLGVSEEGPGFQDRLDAMGIAVGEVWNLTKSSPTSKRKLSWSQVKVSAYSDDELGVWITNNETPVFYEGTISTSGILAALSSALDQFSHPILCTTSPVRLGTLYKGKLDRDRPYYATFQLKK